MTDFEFLAQAHAVLRDAANGCADLERRSHLRTLEREGWRRLKIAEQEACTPLVFILAAGYVTMGTKGQERTLPRPNLAGLDYTWRILLAGAMAQAVLHAELLLPSPGRLPGKALRNRLTAAADWIERTGEHNLAEVVRSILVSDAGDIRYTPWRRVTLAW